MPSHNVQSLRFFPTHTTMNSTQPRKGMKDKTMREGRETQEPDERAAAQHRVPQQSDEEKIWDRRIASPIIIRCTTELIFIRRTNASSYVGAF